MGSVEILHFANVDLNSGEGIGLEGAVARRRHQQVAAPVLAVLVAVQQTTVL
jgi:hypothetical protein